MKVDLKSLFIDAANRYGKSRNPTVAQFITVVETLRELFTANTGTACDIVINLKDTDGVDENATDSYRQGWLAAKEDSKPVARAIYVNNHVAAKWEISGDKHRHTFNTKKDAIAWSLTHGFRLCDEDKINVN